MLKLGTSSQGKIYQSRVSMVHAVCEYNCSNDVKYARYIFRHYVLLLLDC